MEISTTKPIRKNVAKFKSLEEFIKSLGDEEITIKISTSITSSGSTVEYSTHVAAYSDGKMLAKYIIPPRYHNQQVETFRIRDVIDETIKDIEEIASDLRFRSQSLFDYRFKYQ